MTDAATQAAPAPTAPAPTTPVTEATAVPQENLTGPERERRINEAARGIRPAREGMPSVAAEVNAPKDPAKAARAAEQPRGEDGTFAAAPTEAATGEAPAKPPAADDTSPGTDVPDGYVKIPIPEGHPLRARGQEFLLYPKEAEEYGRWSVNQAIKKAEVDAIKSQLAELRNKAAADESAARFWRENAAKYYGADFVQKYEEIKNTWGEEDAEIFRAGVETRSRAELDAVQEKSRQEAFEGEMKTKARQFEDVAVRDALMGLNGNGARFPGWKSADVQTALRAYGSFCVATDQAPTPNGWVQYATAMWQQHPAGRQYVANRRKSEVETKAQTLAAQKEREMLENATKLRSEHPTAALPPSNPGLTGQPGAKPMTNRERIEYIERRAKGLVS